MATPAIAKAPPIIDGPLPDTITATTTTAATTTTSAVTTSPRVLKRPPTEDLPQTPKKQKSANPAAVSTPAVAARILSPSSPRRKPGTNLRIRKTSSKARIPTRGSALAAGYDLYSARDTTIPTRGKALVDTDLEMVVPVETYGRIAPRSGLAWKNFIDVGAGVIDADYRGHVRVLLFNHSDENFVVKEGDRVAQLILERIVTPEVVEVDELEETVRGANGFGSTGVCLA
ncbi:dUTP diphosphatase [Tuber magnatum]|uniref:Deoxyuridine 5'-triphosphate nucleotidohydrolase n=1 Tax=Tuber magnatum TaxID=42249 RepID=A0A317SWK9_9PEZI|nr:dUTP diphosphatase [Tuber magnatum]